MVELKIKGGRVHERAPDAAATADTVLRVAVLLQAGIAPARAWMHLADTGHPVAMGVRDAVAAGAPLPSAISAAGDADGWQHIGSAWAVATTVGAPLAESLRGLAEALRDAQEAADDVSIALAEPAGTAKIMGWLPLVAVLLGTALGFNTLTVLVGNPIGIACLVGGALLIWLSRRWTSRLIAKARPAAGVPGLDAELMAIAMSGGVSMDRARSVVSEASEVVLHPGTDSVLTLSRTTGVPAVELLRAAADLARHRARVDGRLRAAKLSSRLLLPLGVCILPAFLLLGVAPMMLSVMSTMPLSF